MEPEQRRANRRQYFQQNPEARAKRAERSRAWREKNRARFLDGLRKWREKNRDRHRAGVRAWQDANRERTRENSRRWNTENPEHRLAIVKAQKARQRGAGSHTAKDILAQLAAQRRRCFYCGSRLGRSYHVDHIWPVSKGGRNTRDNLVISCASCNLAKGAQDPQIFAGLLL